MSYLEKFEGVAVSVVYIMIEHLHETGVLETANA